MKHFVILEQLALAKQALKITFLALLAGAVIALLFGPFLHAALSQDSSSVVAVADAGSSTAAVALPPPAADTQPPPEWFTKFVVPLIFKHAWLATVVLVMGALRFVVKPVIAGLHWYAERTETPKDDEFIARIENSKVLKWLLFALDWIASVKVVRK